MTRWDDKHEGQGNDERLQRQGNTTTGHKISNKMLSSSVLPYCNAIGKLVTSKLDDE